MEEPSVSTEPVSAPVGDSGNAEVISNVSTEQPHHQEIPSEAVVNNAVKSPAKHWSWSSWLLGAPPLEPEEEVETAPSEQTMEREDIPPEIKEQKDISSANNWLWGGASHLLAVAGKSAAYIAGVGAVEEEAELVEKSDKPSSSISQQPDSESTIVNSSSETPSLSVKTSGLSARLWKPNLWSDMKRDLSEFAYTMQSDTAQLVNSTAAGMKASAHLKSTLHKLGDSHLARKMTEWSEKTLTTVSSYVLTEEEMRGDGSGYQGDDMFMPKTALSSSIRVQNQLHTLLKQPSKLFNSPPNPVEQYEEWLQSLTPLSKEEYVESQSGLLGPLLLEYEEVRREYAHLVPSEVSHEEFFLRYLYHVHRLEKEDKQREELRLRADKATAEGATGDSDEGECWETDDEELDAKVVKGTESSVMKNVVNSSNNIILVERPNDDMVVVRHATSITSGTTSNLTSNENDDAATNESFSSLCPTPAMSPAVQSNTSSANGQQDKQDPSGWEDDLMSEPLTEEEKKLVEEFAATKSGKTTDENDEESEWLDWS